MSKNTITFETGTSLHCLNNPRPHQSPPALQDLCKEDSYPEHIWKHSLPQTETHLLYPSTEECTLVRKGLKLCMFKTSTDYKLVVVSDSFWATRLGKLNALL